MPSNAATAALRLMDRDVLNGMKRLAKRSPAKMRMEMEKIRAHVLEESTPDDIELLVQVELIIEKLSDNLNHFQETINALELLKQNDWNLIWEQQVLIRKAVSENHKISIEEAILFESDSVAWEKELKHIWEHVKNKTGWKRREL